MKRSLSAFSIVLVWCLAAPVLAEDSDKEGARLFVHYGCINCHGAEGRNPLKKGVFILAGKPANKMFDKAMTILNGEGAFKKSQTMYEAFSQCDEPPTREELRQITGWLSAL